jgi:esterase/lipase superfamily enzyme
MRKEYHHWHSPRLGREMGIVVYGHWGQPLVGFPTSAGDEWELEGQGLIGSLADLIDAGKVKFFTVNSVNSAGFYNKDAHPFHRSWVQERFDAYVRSEVVPFIQDHCKSPGLSISTMGASFGAYHAANTLFKHPDVVRRCFALSGVYDIKGFMDGQYDDNTYFNNPVDYLSSLSDPNVLGQLAQCDIHIATGCGPWENSGPSYRLASILSSRGIPHHLDDWGPQGGHDWPYWKHQMREYITRLFA